MKTYTQPAAILPTITKIESEKELTGRDFNFPKRPPHMRYVGREYDRDGDILDQLLSNTKMVDLRVKPERMVQQLEARPESSSSNFSGTQSGLKYLNYFNLPDAHQGIKLDDARRGVYIPEESERGGALTRDYILGSDEGPGTVAGILQRNNQRLDILDEIEHREFGKYNTFTSPPSDFHENKRYRGMQVVEEEKYEGGQDIYDDLIEKINNPRKYLYD